MNHPPTKVFSGGIEYKVKYVHVYLTQRDPRKYPDDVLGYESGVRQWVYIPPRFWEKARKRFWSNSPINKPWYDTHTKSSYYSYRQMQQHIRREMNDKKLWLTIRVEVDWFNHGEKADYSRLNNDKITFDTKNSLKFIWHPEFDDSALFVKKLAKKSPKKKPKTKNVKKTPVRTIKKRKKKKYKVVVTKR